MLHTFLETHRSELLDRCESKVLSRSGPLAPFRGTDSGIASFLENLIESLREGEACSETAGCGCRESAGQSPSRLRGAAMRHGGAVLRRGHPIENVVREYVDLGETVHEIAGQTGAVLAADELLAFQRCLGRASAEAVAEFDRQRQAILAQNEHREATERLGFLAHELRNFLGTAVLSFAAIRSGGVAINGATADVLDRSLCGLRDLINTSLEEVRVGARIGAAQPENIAVESLIGEIQLAASLDAGTRSCEFVVAPVEDGLALRADPKLLNSALSNLVQNAFKFTRPRTHVSLRARASGERVLIEVEDRCGGLPVGKAEELFALFAQHHPNRAGLGLGLSISRSAVENCGGTLSVRDLPGRGCVFTIDLPRAEAASVPGPAQAGQNSRPTHPMAALA
jgi:signal transduction histidine kinase